LLQAFFGTACSTLLEKFFMLMKSTVYAMTSLLAALYPLTQAWAAAPQAEIDNGIVQVNLYLPDSKIGFYRGTRFDWSGIIADLRYQGHSYYGPWFTKADPNVRDFIYVGSDITVGPCSAATGPAEEFTPALGYDEAKPGGTFLKIGVGILRKPDNTNYESYRLYEIVDSGKWSITKSATSVEFRQEIHDPSSGYGYIYKKTVRLLEGKPEMVIEHDLRNVGTHPIDISTYNHNFLVLDKEPPSSDFTITLPFKVAIDESQNGELAKAQSNQIVYLKTLTGKERVYTPVQGFSKNVDDYKIRIENNKVKAGMTISGDRPLAKMALWSIRSVLAVEPFIDISIKPGEDSTWKYHYVYYTLPRSGGN
jgi:hypothetical protein